MAGWSESVARVADLLAVVLYAGLTLAVTFAQAETVLGPPVAISVDGLLRPLLTIPFLLFVPGYAVVAALLPRRELGLNEDLPYGAERFLLAVVTSIALSVIAGVNLEYVKWPISPEPVIVALSAVSLVAVIIAGYRRLTFQRPSHSLGAGGGQRRDTSHSGASGSRMASIAVVVAVLVAVLSVGVVAMDPPRGEQYTEFGLLTETDDGSLVADDYPSEMTLGESETLHFTVTNREQQTMDYVVVVTLVKTNEEGEAVQRTELDTYRNRVAAGDTWRKEHSTRPVIEGENLRLNYLLYRTQKPSQPTVENSYRDLHIWIDVTNN